MKGFFRIPVDDLYALPYLCDALRAGRLADPVIVAPDAGFAEAIRWIHQHESISVMFKDC